jgi:putative membrane protein
LFLGLLPAIVFIPFTWQWIGIKSLLALVYALLVFLFTWLHVRKFRLWAYDDIVFIRRGFLGKSDMMLKWFKIQSVTLSQSIYQRNKKLANLTLSTAAGKITVRYLPLLVARQLANYALYKVESSGEPWI